MAVHRMLLAALVAVCVGLPAGQPARAAADRPTEAETESPWFGRDADGTVLVDLHFFWSLTCPHCRRAAGFLQALEAEQPWLQIHGYEITGDAANARLLDEVARATGQAVQGVPAIFVCGHLVTGFDTAATSGALIRTLTTDCRGYATEILAGAEPAAKPAPPEDTAEVPLLGTIALETASLPLLTVVLAGLDAFNPCAFFVLLILLSLLGHAHGRARMAVVGGTFVLFSGLVYFLFMAAWLNLFVVVGHLDWVTMGAGLVALAVGVLNAKDFFRPGAGASLAIPEAAKPRLFERMRGLVGASSLPLMLAGTVALAVAANFYELLCTAGFPMVFTRALTLQGLGTAGHYLYLAFYNVIYVIPLAVIVGLFTVTVGARKLSERQGRALKLVSGLMMLGLGLVLLTAPELMTDVVTVFGVIATAGAAIAAALWLDRRTG